MSFIKKFYKKILYGAKSSSKNYVNFLRNKGVTIGNNVLFVEPQFSEIDITRPYMLTIGNDVVITEGVKILTHGYEFNVLINLYGEIYPTVGKVVIGNNVFIGMNAIILNNVNIGDNVIIGAGSVVTKDIPSNSVACGNPAKVIMSIDKYKEKRKEVYLSEMKSMINQYYVKTGKLPDESIMREHVQTYCKYENIQKFDNEFLRRKKVIDYNEQNEPLYNSLEELIEDCLDKGNNNE